jgi:hypothetical protein
LGLRVSLLREGEGFSFSRRILRLQQKQIELRWIEFFAAGPKDFSDQQIDLLTQQRVLGLRFFQGSFQGAIFFQKLLFAHAFHCATMKQEVSRFSHIFRGII